MSSTLQVRSPSYRRSCLLNKNLIQMVIMWDDADELWWHAILWQRLCLRVGALHVDVCIRSVASILCTLDELQHNISAN